MMVARNGVPILYLALVVGAIFLASGCAEGNTAPTTSVTPELGELDEIWTQIMGIPPEANIEQRQASAIAAHRTQEEMIASCMAELGFEYIPFLENVPMIIANQDDSIPTGRQWHEQYGYGISTNPPLSATRVVVDPTMHVDPNDELRELFSSAELEAWEAALWGNPADDNWGMTGCFGEAWLATSGVPGESEFDAIRREVDTFYESINSGLVPEIAALNADWASCMADAGFSHLTNPVSAGDLVLHDWNVLLETYGEWSFDDEDWIVDSQRRTAFSELEITIALADYDCREQTAYEQRHDEISFVLQQVFVAQHRNELEAWVAFAEASRVGR